jgi:hypothetical protein
MLVAERTWSMNRLTTSNPICIFDLTIMQGRRSNDREAMGEHREGPSAGFSVVPQMKKHTSNPTHGDHGEVTEPSRVYLACRVECDHRSLFNAVMVPWMSMLSTHSAETRESRLYNETKDSIKRIGESRAFSGNYK